MKKGLVSIICPVYNGEKFLEKTINSYLNQSYKNIEILIVDDFSTDKSKAILKDISSLDKRVKLFFNSQNIGAIKSVNLLLSKVFGEYVCFSAQDDIMYLNKIEIQAGILNENLNYSICTHDYRFYDWNSNNVLKNKPKLSHKKIQSFKDILTNGIPTITAMVRNNNKLKHDLRCPNDDTLLFKELLSDGSLLYNLDKILLLYGRHDNNITSLKNHQNGEIITDIIVSQAILLSKYPKYASIFKKNISNALRNNRRYFNDKSYKKWIIASLNLKFNFKSFLALLAYVFLRKKI